MRNFLYSALALAPYPPAGTFSPLAGRRRIAATSSPPAPRLRGEGKDEGPTPILEFFE